jgi:hypothetical protein
VAGPIPEEVVPPAAQTHQSLRFQVPVRLLSAGKPFLDRISRPLATNRPGDSRSCSLVLDLPWHFDHTSSRRIEPGRHRT